MHPLSNDPPPSMGRTHTARIATLPLHDGGVGGGSEKWVWRGIPDVRAVYADRAESELNCALCCNSRTHPLLRALGNNMDRRSMD